MARLPGGGTVGTALSEDAGWITDAVRSAGETNGKSEVFEEGTQPFMVVGAIAGG